MTRKQTQTLLYAAGVALLFVLIFLIILSVKNLWAKEQAESAQQQFEESILADAATYTSLRYTNATAALSFAQDENGNWYWVDDPEFPLDPSNLKKLQVRLSDLVPSLAITEGDSLDAYGLDQPSATLTATRDDGSTLSLTLGDTTIDGEGVYMLLNQDPTVYIMDTRLVTYLNCGIYDMMALPTLPDLAEDHLNSILVRGPFSTLFTANHDEAITTWRSNGANVTDSDVLTTILRDLRSLALNRCIDYKPSDEAVEICGFNEPAAVVSVTYTDDSKLEQTFVLTIGAALPLESGQEGVVAPNGYYVRINDDSTIYQVDTQAASALLSLAEMGLE